MSTTAAVSPARQEEQIRERLEALARALRKTDVTNVMSHYAPDVVVFDVRPPPHVRGAEAYRKNFERWFGSVHGSIDYEMRDLQIAARGDLATCHYLGHVQFVRTTGAKADYEVRVTSSFRLINGRWMITHEHVSMPIDM